MCEVFTISFLVGLCLNRNSDLGKCLKCYPRWCFHRYLCFSLKSKESWICGMQKFLLGGLCSLVVVVGWRCHNSSWKCGLSEDSLPTAASRATDTWSIQILGSNHIQSWCGWSGLRGNACASGGGGDIAHSFTLAASHLPHASHPKCLCSQQNQLTLLKPPTLRKHVAIQPEHWEAHLCQPFEKVDLEDDLSSAEWRSCLVLTKAFLCGALPLSVKWD